MNSRKQLENESVLKEGHQPITQGDIERFRDPHAIDNMTPAQQHQYQVAKDRYLHVKKVAKGFRQMAERYRSEKAAGKWKSLPEIQKDTKKAIQVQAVASVKSVAPIPPPSTSAQVPILPAAAPANPGLGFPAAAMKLLQDNSALLKSQNTLLKDIRGELLYLNRQIHEIRQHLGLP